MRYKDFSHRLDEIRMNPGALRKQAAGINAIAGMEFEMIVPNVNSVSEGNMVPDYEQDEPTLSINNIENFFRQGEFGMRTGALRRLVNQLEGDYSDWSYEKRTQEWDRNSREHIADYIRDHYSDEELNDPDFDNDRAIGAAKDDFEETWEAPEEQEWLQDAKLTRMTDISDNYPAEWPHYTQEDGESGTDITSVADDFRKAIRKQVVHSTEYHTAKREPNTYIVEPDTSIEAETDTDGGLEFVSPPMPVNDLIQDLHTVKEWARRYGCYTNKSTGLHINVSVEGYSLPKLDFVKLALLLGDVHVLEQFGRSANSYAKSAFKILKNKVASNPEDARAVLQQMKGQLGALATKVIHYGNTDKYTSINTKEGYIEFRSPGGDWLDLNFDKIESTLLRFVVALDSALDPQKDRKEYLTKLYKILQVVDEKQDPVAYFAKFIAGEIGKSELKHVVRNLQQQRLATKQPMPQQAVQPTTGPSLNWEIFHRTTGDPVHYFSAPNQQEAWDFARAWASLRPSTPPADFGIRQAGH